MKLYAFFDQEKHFQELRKLYNGKDYNEKRINEILDFYKSLYRII